VSIKCCCTIIVESGFIPFESHELTACPLPHPTPSHRYNVSEGDILDASQAGGELAVRLAIGESSVVQDNKEYFLAHGVDLQALESSSSKNKASQRSATTLLVKNLPYNADAGELEDMFGK